MNGDGANVVGMGLKRRNLLARVVVVDANLTSQEVSLKSVPRLAESERFTYKSSDPQIIQFFRAMKRPARTGTSVSSKVLTICCVS